MELPTTGIHPALRLAVDGWLKAGLTLTACTRTTATLTRPMTWKRAFASLFGMVLDAEGGAGIAGERSPNVARLEVDGHGGVTERRR